MSHSIYNIYRIYPFSDCILVDHLIRVDNLSFHYFVPHLHFPLKELIFVNNLLTCVTVTIKFLRSKRLFDEYID